MSNHQPYDDDLIIFNAVHRVFICRQHGFATLDLQQHLRDLHEDLPEVRRKEIWKNLKSEACAKDRADIPLPAPNQAPIEGLRPPVRGFKCTSSVGGMECSYISLNVENMAQHARKHHQWRKKRESQQPPPWSEVFTQAFFTTGSSRIYFTVTPPTTILSSSSITVGPAAPTRVALLASVEQDFTTVLSQWASQAADHERSLQQLDHTLLKQDRSGWHRRTEWPSHLAGCHLGYLAHLSRTADKDESILLTLTDHFHRLRDRCLSGLESLDKELRRWLRSARAYESDVRPLGRLQNQASEERYFRYLERFLCYVFRVWIHRQAPSKCHDPDAQSSTASSSTDEENEEDCDDEDENDDSEASSETDTDRKFRRRGYRARALPPLARFRDACRLLSLNDRQERAIIQCFRDVQSLDLQTDLVQDHLVEFFASFIFHKIGGELFQSSLLHFMAVLAIDQDHNRLKNAADFSFVLAGVIYTLRLLGSESLLPCRQRSDQLNHPSTRDEFLIQRREFMSQGIGHGTPMTELISLLGYAKHIAVNTANEGVVAWSQNRQTLYFKGLPIHLPAFRDMIQSALTRTEDILWAKVMWISDIAERFTIDLRTISDDLSCTDRGWSFLSRPDNKLDIGPGWMLNRMFSQPLKTRLRTPLGWNRPRIRRWLRQVSSFLEGLIFLIHATYGQVARGTEIVPIRFRNGAWQDRNIYIIDGAVTIVTRYHKSQSQYDTPKVIPRFLPWRVGQHHVLHDKNGPRETDYLSRILRRHTALGLGHRYGIQDFRHIVVSIGREVCGEPFAKGYGGPGTDEDDEAEAEREDDPVELQSGRGEATGIRRYGVPIHVIRHLSSRSIDIFRPLSEAWHRFLTLSSQVPSDEPSQSLLLPKRKARDSWELPPSQLSVSRPPSASVPLPHPQGTTNCSCQAVLSSTIKPPSRCHSAQPAPPAPSHGTNSCSHPLASLTRLEPPSWSLEAIERALGTALRSESFSFRSDAQREAIAAVFNREPELTVVMPTGGGKTLLALAPAVTESDGITFFIVPFRALLDNLLDRFQQAHVPCLEWTPGESRHARIVLVSANFVPRWEFLVYAQLMKETGLVRRVFVDESHVAFKDSDWRTELAGLKMLHILHCPIIYLSATLPPVRLPEFHQSLHAWNTRIIRESTIRPRHHYLVERCKPGTLFAQAVAICEQVKSRLGYGEKAIIYCLSRSMCEQLAAQLDCLHYFAGLPDRSERQERWAQDSGLIVATGALGTGVDISGIVFTLHIDIPWGMIDFAQESGRGGRQGENVTSKILVETGRAEAKQKGPYVAVDREVMLDFITTTRCRRLIMSLYLDGADLARPCSSDPSWAACDRCGNREQSVSLEAQRHAARLESMRSFLTDYSDLCPFCWHARRPSEAATHSAHDCPHYADLIEQVPSFWTVEKVRKCIRYDPKSITCFSCGLSLRICDREVGDNRQCEWPNLLIPLLIIPLLDPRAFENIVKAAGYQGSRERYDQYVTWAGKVHGQRICDVLMSNAMAVLFQFQRFHQELHVHPPSRAQIAQSSTRWPWSGYYRDVLEGPAA